MYIISEYHHSIGQKSLDLVYNWISSKKFGFDLIQFYKVSL